MIAGKRGHDDGQRAVLGVAAEDQGEHELRIRQHEGEQPCGEYAGRDSGSTILVKTCSLSHPSIRH